MSQWNFMALGKGHVGDDPFEIEFFHQEPLVESFVRQAIQNTLDATVEGGAVECRIKFCQGTEFCRCGTIFYRPHSPSEVHRGQAASSCRIESPGRLSAVRGFWDARLGRES